MELQIRNWLDNWFKQNVGLGEDTLKQKDNENYFEMDWIDSFKFISFVMDIEKEFGISFSNDEFQNREFTTLQGLTKIIKLRVDEKKNE